MIDKYQNSKLIEYLTTHSIEDVKELGIKVKIDENNLAIFNYKGADEKIDFNNPIVRESRGIIVDLDTLNIVCRSFDKFFNLEENYAEKIDWNSAIVMEKIDGSIVKYFYNPKTNKWEFATNSCINASQANINDNENFTFENLIYLTTTSKSLLDLTQNNKLNKDCTYIFELTTPYNVIVIKYPISELRLIGIRNNKTGKEYDIYDDNEICNTFKKPIQYSCVNLNDCKKILNELNKFDNKINFEGFVVRDKNYKRIKIKTEQYIMAHYIRNNGKEIVSKERLINIILDNYDNISQLINIAGNNARIIYYYLWQLEEIYIKADKMAVKARGLFEEYGYDRKAVALKIKDDPLSAVGFNALNKKNLSGREMIPKHLLFSLINQYE